MTGERERPEDQLDKLLSAEDAASGDDVGELSSLREVAGRLRDLRTTVPMSQGTTALAAMMSELETARMNEKTGGIAEALAGWWKRPVMRTGVAVTAAVLVLSGAGLGAAAATGNEPVRNLLGISSSSTIKVEFEGTVVSVNGSVLAVSANGDIRTVVIDAGTDLTRGGDRALSSGDIVAGQFVEVHGRLQADNSILATRFHLEDGDDGPGGTATAGAPTQAAPTANATGAVPTVGNGTVGPQPTADATPNPQSTVDDHGDDRDDDDDDGDDDGDDNSGPGNGDHDNSGPGGGDDDNSGPDGGADDNSGSGSGGGDNSGSGSGGGDDS
jgi:hypothetical protein